MCHSQKLLVSLLILVHRHIGMCQLAAIFLNVWPSQLKTRPRYLKFKYFRPCQKRGFNEQKNQTQYTGKTH